MSLDQLWTAQDVADHIKIPLSSVRRHRRIGDLKGTNYGTKRRPMWRFTTQEVEDYKQARARKAAA